MSRKRKMASITSAGLVFAMLLSQSAVADLGTEQVKAAEDTAKWADTNYVVNGDFESGADIGILIYQRILKTGYMGQEQKKDIIVSGRIKQRKKKMYQSHRLLSFRPVLISLE